MCRLVYIAVIATGLYYIAAAIATCVECRPRGGANDLAAGVCQGFLRPQCRGVTAPVQYLTLVSCSINVVVDFYLLLIPLPAVYELMMPRKRKTGLMLIFLSGAM